MLIRLGHSPDSDDAFMFWGLASGKVETDLEFEHILRDIQTLNEWSREARLESSAVSVHNFAHIAGTYALLRHGGSFGEGYGPMVVTTEPMEPAELKDKLIAIPGEMTSAFLELNIWFHEQFGTKPKTVRMDFDKIMDGVKAGEADAGLIIHEGQLTYEEEGMHEVVNMGVWWRDRTGGLPLPLGVNVVRKDLGEEVCTEVSRCMRESISAGLDNRDEAVTYALKFARGMDRQTSDTFVGMYVNDRTRDMGDDGLEAIKRLLKEGAEIGMVPHVEVEVID